MFAEKYDMLMFTMVSKKDNDQLQKRQNFPLRSCQDLFDNDHTLFLDFAVSLIQVLIQMFENDSCRIELNQETIYLRKYGLR